MPGGDAWTINLFTGPGDGSKLNGVIITRNATQTQLFAPPPPPSSATEVGSENSVTPPITFDSISLPGSDAKFNITISTFTYGPTSDEAHGTWAAVDERPGGDPNSGDWTAQSGVGVAEAAKPADAKLATDEKPAADEKAAAADSSRGT